MSETDTLPADVAELAPAGRLEVEYVRADLVQTHPKNARQGDVGAIHESMATVGVYRPVIAQQSTGYILAGNHTYMAMVQSGMAEVPVVWRDVDDVTARKIMLADNRTADLGDYDQGALIELLSGLPDLSGTGYASDDLAELAAGQGLDGLDDNTNLGERLALLDVTWGDPDHQVSHGDTWIVGRHLLVVAELSDEHHLWAMHLKGRIFAPYPEPYLTFSQIARDESLLLVQPNKFLAGQLLDAHAQGFPEETVADQETT